MTYNTVSLDWGKPTPFVDLLSDVSGQVLTFFGFTGAPTSIFLDKKESVGNDNYILIPRFVFNGFETRMPIRVCIEADDDETIVSFEETGISFSASTVSEAISLLQAQIMYTYENFKSAKTLGPVPTRQLQILEKYIGEAGRV